MEISYQGLESCYRWKGFLAGLVTKIKTPGGYEIRRAYDANDRLIETRTRDKKNGIDRRVCYCYDAAGNRIRETVLGAGGETLTTTYQYDLKDRLTHSESPGEGAIRYLYDQNDRLIRELRPYGGESENGAGTSYRYDSRGNRIRETNALGQMVKEQTCNLQNRVTVQVDGLGNRTEYEYTPSEELKEIRIGNQKDQKVVQSYEYNARGQIIGIVDGNGTATRYDLDGWGRITGTVFADGCREGYEYNLSGQVSKAIDANGNAVTYRYNSLGKLREREDQLGDREFFVYDEEGNLACYTDREGRQTTWLYNVFGNPVYERAVDREGKHPCITTYVYDSIGRITRAVCDGHSYEYRYNEQGLLTEKRSSGKRLIAYEYDSAGQIIQITDPAGVSTRYERDILGRIVRANSDGMEVFYTYDCLNRLTSQRYGNGVTTDYQYDESGNVSRLETKKDGEILLSLDYQYDGNGNRIKKQGQQRLVCGESSTIYTTYRYSVRNQLTEETQPEAMFRYSYDAAGNRLGKDAPDGVTTYQYNAKNQLVCEEGARGKRVFTYDRQGSIITEEGSFGTRNYLYNSKNQQTGVKREDGQIQINRYDPEGLRCEMKENEALLRFVYHNGELLYEKGGAEETSYYLGYGIQAWKRNQETFYYHQDEQLSTALITDRAGKVKNHYQYSAFGEMLKSAETVSNRIGYTGQQYDGLTGQYYLRARYYNPIVGRFMQEDVYQGDGLNLYAYCGNNPVMYFDPSGYDSQKDLVSTISGMTYDEKLDALYRRRNEYVQGKIDNGKLIVSDAPLRTNELEVGSYSTAPRTTGDGVTPHHMPSAHSIGVDGIDYNNGACINMMGSTHTGTFTYGLNEKTRPYDAALYESLTYVDRLEFDRADFQDIYARTRPNVPEAVVEEKLREQYDLAMKTEAEAEAIKGTTC